MRPTLNTTPNQPICWLAQPTLYQAGGPTLGWHNPIPIIRPAGVVRSYLAPRPWVCGCQRCTSSAPSAAALCSIVFFQIQELWSLKQGVKRQSSPPLQGVSARLYLALPRHALHLHAHNNHSATPSCRGRQRLANLTRTNTPHIYLPPAVGTSSPPHPVLPQEGKGEGVR